MMCMIKNITKRNYYQESVPGALKKEKYENATDYPDDRKLLKLKRD